MAYYYVRDDGTAAAATDDGRYASQQSGSFDTLGVANFYGSVEIAMAATTAPDHGDFVCLSDAHSYTDGGTISWATVALVTTAIASTPPLTFMTVSDIACNQYAVATVVQEKAANGSDIFLIGPNADDAKFSLLGVYVVAQDDLFITGGSQVFLRDCTFEVTGSGDKLLSSGGVTRIKAYNCEFITTGATTNDYFYDVIGEFYDCTFTTIDALVDTIATFSNNAILFSGCDFSSSAASYLAKAESTAKFAYKWTFLNCALPTTLVDFYSSRTIMAIADMLVAGCADSAGEAEYQYYVMNGQSQVEDETGFYRTGSRAYPVSGDKVCLKIVTGTEVVSSAEFTFNAPTRFAELANTATDTMRFYLLSSDSGLKHSDIRIEVSYADGTNTHVRNIAESSAYSVFTAGTALTTNTEAWNSRTTETRYQIDVDTSGDVGADCVPTVRVYVAKPSITVYLCTDVDLTTT